MCSCLHICKEKGLHMRVRNNTLRYQNLFSPSEFASAVRIMFRRPFCLFTILKFEPAGLSNRVRADIIFSVRGILWVTSGGEPTGQADWRTKDLRRMPCASAQRTISFAPQRPGSRTWTVGIPLNASLTPGRRSRCVQHRWRRHGLSKIARGR